MAISSTPFVVQNGSHSADLFRQAASSLVPAGGGVVTAGDLAVTQTGTASMNVVFGVGRAWVPGTNVGNVIGGNFSKQAMYFALNDAAYTASIATSDPVNPRIDVAYLAVQDSQYAGSANNAVLGVATGVAVAGASYPANAPVIPANAIKLAYINVAANASSIVNANITALATALKVPSQQWDRASSTNDNMTTGDSVLITGTIKNAPAGQYRIDGYVCCYGNPSAVGSVFVNVGGNYYRRRWDLPNNTAQTPTCSTVYSHGGGDLTVGTGYTVVSGTAAVTSQANGYTSVVATFIG